MSYECVDKHTEQIVPSFIRLDYLDSDMLVIIFTNLLHHRLSILFYFEDFVLELTGSSERGVGAINPGILSCIP
jgi:hypothetical protein